jgi:methionyl-tRNA formyltransferase
MKTIFMGSGDFSLELFLDLIKLGFRFRAVVTRPDRPAGRGLRRRPTPLKTAASREGLPVFQPENLHDTEMWRQLSGFHPDFILVADYGLILPAPVLAIPSSGCVNVHPSLLPRYRGAAPIRRALMDGVEETGVTLIIMDEGTDTGPVVAQSALRVGHDENHADLCRRLAATGAEMVIKALPEIAAGEVKPVPQDEALATYAPPIRKSDLDIKWSESAEELHNLIRAMSPRPGAFTLYKGKRLKILASTPSEEECRADPGTIIDAGKSRLKVATGRGCLEIEAVQPEGKKVISAAEFLRGYRLQAGDAFREGFSAQG